MTATVGNGGLLQTARAHTPLMIERRPGEAKWWWPLTKMGARCREPKNPVEGVAITHKALDRPVGRSARE